MITTSDRAVEKLREQLINKCVEAGIGFRMDVSMNESGETTFSIRIDRQRQGDEVMESDGVKIFLDSASARRTRDCQLDYRDESGGFFLNTIQEVKGGQD